MRYFLDKKLAEKLANEAALKIIEELVVDIGIDVSDVLGPSRKAHIVRVRVVAMKKMRVMGFSLPLVGFAFNRDHATVYHAISKPDEKKEAT